MIPSRLIIPLTALMFTCTMGLAQDPAADSAAAPRIELSTAQKQTIYESVTKTQKNNPEPTGFRAAVGATVPASIALVPVPDTIAKLSHRGLLREADLPCFGEEPDAPIAAFIKRLKCRQCGSQSVRAFRTNTGSSGTE